MTPALDLIVPENFIQATRDSGYKSLGSAIAELIDNAFEAKAQVVHISLEKSSGPNEQPQVIVADDGRGMDADTLRQSLRFGWSSRFNQRNSHGRYGMGLPNASLSHARRLEVWSSQDGVHIHRCCLDVDEVVKGASIPPAQALPAESFRNHSVGPRGTVVVWRRCDRLANRKFGPLSRKLRSELGRLFRYQLWMGKQITVNGEAVEPFDPMFVGAGANLQGATPVGPEMTYEVELPPGGPRRTSTVKVVFTELPIGLWHSLSNAEKNDRGIAKNAGVSIVRAGREIDRGWFFMGQKRKENYDDWWRCEVRFQPDLDELFGVTHTKQEIRPTEHLLGILVPDMEKIARDLNAKARRGFLEVKGDAASRESERLAEAHDSRLDPPRRTTSLVQKGKRELRLGLRGRVGGLEYRLRFERLEDGCLYDPVLEGTRVTVRVNEAHPLVHSLFHSNPSGTQHIEKARRNLELLLLAAARSELAFTTHKKAKTWIKKFRQSWSHTLAAFLG